MIQCNKVLFVKDEFNMKMEDELRIQLIKQFGAEVLIAIEEDGTENYICPTCRRPVAKRDNKCFACEQVLKWDNVKRVETQTCGVKTGTISFQVPGDFVKGNCRKCPISYIARRDNENVYDCPLNMRSDCPITLE